MQRTKQKYQDPPISVPASQSSHQAELKRSHASSRIYAQQPPHYLLSDVEWRRKNGWYLPRPLPTHTSSANLSFNQDAPLLHEAVKLGGTTAIETVKYLASTVPALLKIKTPMGVLNHYLTLPPSYRWMISGDPVSIIGLLQMS